ncbi:MAG: RNA 2',3'-cyclic phosphodiesterase [Thermoprotei archaeon]|nr:RNA 2',3'-cyclic phosphodiesterase [Thermoprotei archaeon]
MFIAVDVEEPLLVSRLQSVMNSLASTNVDMKLVEPYNLHVTLRFIGEVSPGVAGEISRALSRLSFKSFKVVFKGLGAFPSTLKPRVVWVGVSEGFKEMVELRASIEKLLKSVGIPPEREDFAPHLTLARIRGSRNLSSLVKLLNDMSDYDVGSMIVDRVRLKKSTLTSSGPIYETLLEVKASQ